MDKQKLMKLIPYVILIVSVVFTLYAASILQNVENQCNTHLNTQYERLVEMYPIIGAANSNPIFNTSIDLPDLFR